MIEAVIERCAGIDVGRKFVVACVMVGEANAAPRHEIRKFLTVNADLVRLREWLHENRCTHVAMESTASYWKPIFHVLDDGKIRVILANSQQVKNLRGHKDGSQRQPVAGPPAAARYDPAEFYSAAG